MRKTGRYIVGACVAASLAACGGGGSGTTATGPGSLTGLAATGAAIASGSVTAKCVAGPVLSGSTDANGIFDLPLTTAHAAPCLLQVSKAGITLHSVATAAGLVNITPITELVVTKALGGDPATAFTNPVKEDFAKFSSTNLQSAVADIRSKVIEIAGSAPVNPMSGKFVVGDADDQILDVLAQSLTASSKSVGDLRTGVINGSTFTDILLRAPTGTTAAANGISQIDLSWASVASATGYKVYRSSIAGAVGDLIASPTGTTYSDTGLTASTTYYYRVMALNATATTNVKSIEFSATTSGPVPSAPANALATPNSESQITVTWDSVSGATGYKVYRTTTSGGVGTLVASPSGTSYADSGLAASTQYYYTVKAVNASGDGVASSQASATTTAASGGSGGGGAAPTVTSYTPLTGAVGTTVVISGTNLGNFTPALAVKFGSTVATVSAATSTSISVSVPASLGTGNATITLSNSDGSGVLTVGTFAVSGSAVIPLLTYPLNDTGITNAQCYAPGDTTTKVSSCTAVAATGLNAAQDGMVGRDVSANNSADGSNGFSFALVPNGAGGNYTVNECVKDNVTGLVWEGKTTGAYTATNYRTSQERYTNNGVGGTLTTDVSTYIQKVNADGLCGFSDWRLPTVAELHSLVNYGVSGGPGVLSIDYLTWFPGPPRSNVTDITAYWTSTSAKPVPSGVTTKPAFKAVDFYGAIGGGGVGSIPYDSNAPARLVRGDTASITASNRYTVSTDGTEVADGLTGLTWRRCVEGQSWNGTACTGTATVFSHEQALAHAKTQSGWKVPNIKELYSIVKTDKLVTGNGQWVDTTAFPNQPFFLYYWSSTPVAYYWSSDYAWLVNFSSGDVTTYKRDVGVSSGYYPVRLVKQ